ncbi:MAG TPA: STAS domain-containing protein [Actinomycetota bacterium]|jgi:anti-sigma B factor antagonist|nr:STAS domain-containing protein [Actinomycetota bacterium]
MTGAAMDVRKVNETASIVDIKGEVTAASEAALMDAYSRAGTEGARTVVLNFTDLEYMNSSGIGLLVTLLIRANRQNQSLVAFGLNDHYREIFNLTRLDEAITIHDDEAAALAATGS